MFCTGYFETCGNSEFNDYGEPGACIQACSTWTAGDFECRTNHLGMAPADMHCAHAGASGGGVC
jgi:hypothetical protein